MFREISIFGHVTMFHLVLMAFQITKYHMSVRKPWSSQFSGAFQDVIMRYGALLNLFPSKATQRLSKSIQKSSSLLTKRLVLHQSPNLSRRFLLSFVILVFHCISATIEHRICLELGTAYVLMPRRSSPV